MKLLYQQDDCAPDAHEFFLKKFQKIVGISFPDWKAGKTNCSSYDDTVTYKDDTYLVTCSADDPYWKLFQLNS